MVYYGYYMCLYGLLLLFNGLLWDYGYYKSIMVYI